MHYLIIGCMSIKSQYHSLQAIYSQFAPVTNLTHVNMGRVGLSGYPVLPAIFMVAIH